MNGGDILIVGGFSGAGKGTVLQKILKQHPELELICSCTTRPKRKETTDRYIFLSEAEFNTWKLQGRFLETNVYGGHSYGTPVWLVQQTFLNGKTPLLEIDAKGMEQLKQSVFLAGKEIKSIFIAVPGPAILYRRLLDRKSESLSSILKRMEEAKEQCALLQKYDYIVVNDKLEETISKLECFLSGGKQKSTFDGTRFLNDLERIQLEIKERRIETLDELDNMILEGSAFKVDCR